MVPPDPLTEARGLALFASTRIPSVDGEIPAIFLPLGVAIGYTAPAMKDAGLRIRVQRELRDQFLAACRTEDRPAAQVLRDFMRAYVAANDGEKTSKQVLPPRKKAEAGPG